MDSQSVCGPDLAGEVRPNPTMGRGGRSESSPAPNQVLGGGGRERQYYLSLLPSHQISQTVRGAVGQMLWLYRLHKAPGADAEQPWIRPTSHILPSVI